MVEDSRSILGRLRDGILGLFWYVHPTVLLLLAAPPPACLQTLALAAKPDVRRLHLRDLFADGRRYEVRVGSDLRRFTITTTHNIRWQYRRRTSAVARLSGRIEPVGEGGARVRLNIRIRLMYLLDTVLLPTFVASIVIYMNWHVTLIVAAVVALYTLSWLGHYYNAKFEANEMVYFVQKALEDFIPPPPPELAAASPEVTLERDFRAAWERFYEQHQEE